MPRGQHIKEYSEYVKRSKEVGAEYLKRSDYFKKKKELELKEPKQIEGNNA